MNTAPRPVWLRPKSFLIPLPALAALLAVWLPAPVTAQEGPPPALVRVAEAIEQEVRERRLIVGQVEAGRRSIVAAEEPGRVVAAPPEAGLAVRQGDVLATIDTDLLELDLEGAAARTAEAEAQVEEAQAQLQVSTRERERLVQLVEREVAPRRELEDALDREAANRARLHAAEAALRRSRNDRARLERRVEKSRIVAPFDAYVVRKETEVGQWLAAGQAVAELVELERVKVRLDVPESMIQQVPRNEPVPLTIEALGETLDGELFSIVPDADPRSRTFSVLVELENADGRIKPGMSARAHLPTGVAMRAMTVPRDAVQSTPSGTVVYANRDGVAAPIRVQVRFGSGDRFIIDGAGLRHGEQVVVQGNERLAPNQPLQIVEDPEDEAENPGTAEIVDDAVGS